MHALNRPFMIAAAVFLAAIVVDANPAHAAGERFEVEVRIISAAHAAKFSATSRALLGAPVCGR